MQFLTKKAAKRKISSILQGNKRASPVPHLVKTNDPPSDAEITLVQDALVKAREELDVLEYQLGGHTSATHHDTLRKDKKTCEKFIRAHVSILSLIRRLPDDILATIFYELAFSTRPYHSHPPWAASKVCRNWRAVALSLPHLWKRVSVRLDVESQKTHAYLTFLTNHLDRSRQVPLNLFVACGSSAYDYVNHPFIDILCRYAERWGAISLTVPGHTLQAFARVKGRLRLLHSVSIFLLSHGPYQDGSPLDIFEDAPSLCEFSIHTSSPFPSLRLNLPWSQLLSYEDNTTNNHVALTHALANPSLQRLAVSFKRPYGDLIPFSSGTTLSTLQRFSISLSVSRGTHEPLPEFFLDGLSLPGITESRFVNYLSGPTASASSTGALADLIKRSRCNQLTVLEFAPTTITLKPRELSGVLRLVPQLKELTTYLPDVVDLQDLYLEGESPTNLVPALQRLVFHVPTVMKNDQARALAQIAWSRCEIAILPRSESVTVAATDTDTATKAQPPAPSPSPPQFQSLASRLYLRIVTYNLQFWHEFHQTLEASFEAVEMSTMRRVQYSTALTELKHCIETLHHLLKMPHKEGLLGRAFDIGSHPGMKEFERSVAELMGTLEKLEFEDYEEFHEAGIHHFLYHIVQVITAESSRIGQRSNFPHWKERGEKLLDLWNDKFVYPSLAVRRWAFQGFNSFVYTPLDHESRNVVPHSLKMMYGKTFFMDKLYPEESAATLVPSQLAFRD